jgi:hypothetical protein
MTPLKFRTWHKIGKIMSFGGFFFNNSTGELEHDPSCVVMQSTGLHDKNGTEVFEGDILEIEGATAKVVFWERPPEFGLDYFHNEDAWCEDWNITDDSSRMQIVGNIYENPDLLPNHS